MAPIGCRGLSWESLGCGPYTSKDAFAMLQTPDYEVLRAGPSLLSLGAVGPTPSAGSCPLLQEASEHDESHRQLPPGEDSHDECRGPKLHRPEYSAGG